MKHIKREDLDELYFSLVCDLYQKRFEYTPYLTEALWTVWRMKESKPVRTLSDEALKIIGDALSDIRGS